MKPLTYKEQRLWLRALGKVLFEGNYTLMGGSISISVGPDPGEFGVNLRIIDGTSIPVQAEFEFEKAVELGELEDWL